MIRSSYAFINLVKAMCGVGVFALPVAFQQAGLWTGTVLAFALGVVNAQSMTKLVKCSQYLGSRKETEKDISKSDEAAVPMISLSEKDTSKTDPEDNTTHSHTKSEGGGVEKRVALNYGNMAHEAFASKESESLRNLAKPAKIFVNICIIGLQVGFCSSYYIFVVDHAKEAIDYLFSTEISRDTLFFSVLPFFILIASVRSLAVLSWIGLLGNILVISSIVIIIGQMLFMDHIPLSQLPAFASIEGATLAAGSIIYAYSAQGVVLPLENKMKKPKDMLGPLGVISTSVAFISVVYTTTGFLGYVTYGDKLKGSITLNLTNSP
ncbi:transmembrane amino acid transporter protein [Oesophagostomum dentatum]|uniref:Transmembrane amino acid transporter protein n=1 Tax=Oesophagostomum dentatum TaxID=61180 RepID=A0A0B1T6K7_OESDE|nr:transmembrane amino acid transporter protein [Oesophagostomum dentatum]